jgi:3-hydroxybutyryl-CoA dehydrogenase
LTETTTIGVVGAGAMGRGIAQWAATAGHRVILHDARDGAVAEARGFVDGILARSVEKGRMAGADRRAIIGRIVPAGSAADLAPAGIVVEAVIEDLAVKQAVFAELEGIVGDEAILCTNTSSLSVTACAAATRRPERVAGLHFFNPVPLMKVVEVVRGQRTSDAAVARLRALVATTEHHAVTCEDSPGFVVNHAGRGLPTEGARIVQEGVAGFSEVDRVMRETCGFRMGPFELFDLTGLDVSSEVLRQIYDQYFQEPRYRPAPFLYRRVTAGLFGRKSGEGFYRYEGGRRIDPPEVGPGDVPAAPVHVAVADTAVAERIGAALASGGVEIVAGPEAAAAIVVAPFGGDATTAAVQAGLDPALTVGIDPLFDRAFGDGGRVTMMTTPATRPEAADMVHAALLRSGRSVTRIGDSPGFIAQRVVATIVNIGAEIAQQRVALPADIDEAVRRGLGYPAGPLALGDRIGAARIVEILTGIQAATGDPRYRPSLWLKRRALLGLSLLTPEGRYQGTGSSD